MTLIINPKKHLADNMPSTLIHFYRQNPVIAASHLLVRGGESLILAPIQQIILEEWWNSNFSILTASRGTGKALLSTSKVLTPKGWVQIKDLNTGDKVITPTGKESKIEGVFPQGKTENYKFTFADGRQATCCKDHLWNVIVIDGYNKIRPNEWQTLNTLQIKEFLDTKAKKQHQSIRIPLVEDVFLQKESKKLFIHPYIIGALIGDGGLTHRAGFSSVDSFILDKINRLLPSDFSLSKGAKYDFVTIRKKRNNKNELIEHLSSLNLLGKKSYEKSIPDLYMGLSRSQTLQMLQGLFDTEDTEQYGRARNRQKSKYVNDLNYCTTSKVLAEQIQNLIWKLGGMCGVSTKTPSFTYKGIKKKGRLAYNLNIRYKNKKELFTLPRKLNKLSTNPDLYSKNLGLDILNIEKVRDSDTVCIKIDDPAGLFIIDNYVVTHNTFLAAVYSALRCLLYPGTKIGIFAPAFRQSKLIFKEFEKLHNESPFLQQCIDKQPTYLNDQCIATFKSAIKGREPSHLIAMPIGNDGGKIRGARLNKVLMDEIVHVPNTIFRSVIQPMLSTAVNPMQQVKLIEKMRAEKQDIKLIDDIMQGDAGYIGITSGYYQFNYWWQEISKFYEKIQQGSSKYSLRFVPYTELPEGFFNQSVVQDALENSPLHMFQTEWLAEWISDSEGAFPMSLLESCRDELVVPKSSRSLDFDKGKEFIFGIDVARDRDSTAIVVIEIGYPSKVVHIVELTKVPFPQQAKAILLLVRTFNPVLIYMDLFGGGKTLADHLADPKTVGFPETDKIVEKDAPLSYSGKRILNTIAPNPEFIEDANNNTKTLLEQGMMKFPTANHPIEGFTEGGANKVKKEVDLVQEMIHQIASIVITSTGTSGRLHYDLPKSKSSGLYNVKKKDLYSAFVLACKCVYDLKWQPKGDRHLVEVGVVKEVDQVNLTRKSSSIILPTDRITGTISSNNGNSTKHIISGGGVIVTRNGRKR